MNDAPWQDIVIEGDDLDLSALPIPLQFSVDGGPYITAGKISARDPVTGVDTTGFHRLMLKGRNRPGLSLHSRRRLMNSSAEPRKRGSRFPPQSRSERIRCITWARWSMPIRHVCGKFEIVGGLFGEPCRVVRCGIGDIEVPAGAEIVIEGEILADTRETEGPFDDFTGYASYRSTQHVFVAHRLHMRRDAMFQSVTSGMSKDHILVSCVTREGEILNALRRNLPNVRAVHVPHTSCGAFTVYISMKKIAEGEPQIAIMTTLGTEFYTKHVIVVDDDVDIFDTNDVMWDGSHAGATRQGHFPHPRRQGSDARPDLGSGEFHRDKDGDRRHAACGSRIRRTSRDLRRAACTRPFAPAGGWRKGMTATRSTR